MSRTDFLGNSYDVGDTVLYPRMSGRSVEMQAGVVVAFKEYQEKDYERNPHWKDGDDYRLRYIEKTVTKFKVQVQPTKSSRFRHWDDSEKSKVWITNVENITKVDLTDED